MDEAGGCQQNHQQRLAQEQQDGEEPDQGEGGNHSWNSGGNGRKAGQAA